MCRRNALVHRYSSRTRCARRIFRLCTIDVGRQQAAQGVRRGGFRTLAAALEAVVRPSPVGEDRLQVRRWDRTLEQHQVAFDLLKVMPHGLRKPVRISPLDQFDQRGVRGV